MSKTVHIWHIALHYGPLPGVFKLFFLNQVSDLVPRLPLVYEMNIVLV